MSRCNVIVENSNDGYCFCSGSEIKGRVECYFKKEKKVRTIKVRLICMEFNSWTTTRSLYNNHTKQHEQRTVTLKGEKYIIYNEIILHSAQEEKMPPGLHVYPFSFQLPMGDIPSTYTGPFGGIHYKLEAITDRPMKTDYKDSFQINVLSLIDFNYRYPELQGPKTFTGDKSFFSLFRSGGHLKVNVDLEKLAFTPGETITMKITVDNQSHKRMSSLKVCLKQVFIYKVNSPDLDSIRRRTTKLLKVHGDGVGRNSENFYDLKLSIPTNLEVPNFVNCSLFECQYSLEVTCKVAGLSRDLHIHIYPVVGHRPNVHGYPSYTSPAVPFVPVPDCLQPSAPPTYEDLRKF